MRKLIWFIVLGTVVLAVTTPESSAGWRHRRGYLCPPCPPCPPDCAPTVIVWSPAGLPPTSARLPRKPVLETETIVSPVGRSHRLLTIDDLGWQEPTRAAELRPEIEAGTAGETFNGNDREAAKTSTGSGPVEPFDDLAALVTTLPADNFMRERHNPVLTKDRMSMRAVEEQRNVSVVAYLVATKKEKDNDFHLILATTPDGDGPYLTAEVSGLPRLNTSTAADKATLKAARAQYRVVLNNRMPGPRYKIVDPPLAVAVTGSLFFDMDHEAGVVGTGDFKPATSWEIHPVSSITAVR
jgi:hypothetical protein